MRRIIIVSLGLILLACKDSPKQLDCAELNKQVEFQLERLANLREMGRDHDVTYLDDSLPAANQELYQLFVKTLHPERTTCRITIDGLTHVTSADNKIELLSWDTEMGGTMIEHATVVIFHGNDLSKVWRLNYESGLKPGNFYQIESIKNANGETSYVILGFRRGSSLSHQLIVIAFRIHIDSIELADIFPDKRSEISIFYDGSTKFGKDTVSMPEILDHGQRIRIPYVDEDSGALVKFLGVEI